MGSTIGLYEVNAQQLLCLGLLGLALLAMDKRREALACVAERDALLAALVLGRLSALSTQGCLALMAVAVGDVERAASYCPEMLACQGRHHWFLVDRILGQIAILGGAWSTADARLAAAAFAIRHGLVWWTANRRGDCKGGDHRERPQGGDRKGATARGRPQGSPLRFCAGRTGEQTWHPPQGWRSNFLLLITYRRHELS